MFALFEAGLQRKRTNPNPRLRRCAPYLGLLMYNLFEVDSSITPDSGRLLFPPEVSRDVSPLSRLPLDDRCLYSMCAEPFLCTRNDGEERLRALASL